MKLAKGSFHTFPYQMTTHAISSIYEIVECFVFTITHFFLILVSWPTKVMLLICSKASLGAQTRALMVDQLTICKQENFSCHLLSSYVSLKFFSQAPDLAIHVNPIALRIAKNTLVGVQIRNYVSFTQTKMYRLYGKMTNFGHFSI